MTRLTVVDRSGVGQSIDAEVDRSVMEIIRDAGIVELLALCGGCVCCATCHVYVDAESLELLPAMSEDEDDLLDSSSHRRAQSRLSCQIRFTEPMDGLSVAIAPED